MGLFQVERLSFIDGRDVQAGEKIQYAGVPGKFLTPLDDEAKAQKEAAESGRVPPAPGSVGAMLEHGHGLVVIPDDWKQMTPAQIINLARKLGAPARGTGKEQAIDHIKAELIKRQVK
jgi:hypothetical protein